MRVHCTAQDGGVYRNFAATAVAEEGGEGKKGLNVIVLGLDSLSRLSFMRNLPRTYDYLTKTLGAVVLEGYNIVGDGTPQALLPILTGQTELELPNTRKGDADAKFVDVYPWLWDEFRARGYATAYIEDTTDSGTWQYRYPLTCSPDACWTQGFEKQPTDHYSRTFFLDRDSYSGQLALRSIDWSCMGPEPVHKFLLRYMASMLENHAKPVFSASNLGLLSHNDINLVQVMDDDFQAHLAHLQTSQLLNRTMLIVMADHGSRYSGLRSTHQGQLEERLPFVSITAPQWWREKNPGAWAALEVNKHRLTSPFDLHVTLRDLLHWDKMGGTEGPKGKEQRGRSLWKEVPKGRTCTQADIAPHWCTCLHWEDVDVKSEIAATVADVVIRGINKETASLRNLCAELSMDEIVSVKREVPNQSLLRYSGAVDDRGFVGAFKGRAALDTARYQLTLRTRPNLALYEATLALPSQGEGRLDMEQVSRINLYGDQPACIKDRSHTRLLFFCYCPPSTSPPH